MQPKIAICFFGITRSLKHTIASIDENIISPAKQLGEVRVFAHFFDQKRVESRRSRESTVLDPSEYTLLRPDEVEFEKPELCLDVHDFEGLKKYGDARRDDFQSLRNLTHALHSLDKVKEMALRWSPDVVVFARPDLLYHHSLGPPINSALEASKDTVLIPNWQHWRGGYNDRFAVCSSVIAAKVYGSRISLVHEYCDYFSEPLHAELLNRYAIEKSSVSVDFFEARATRVRADGRLKNEVFDMSIFEKVKTSVRQRFRERRLRRRYL